MPLQRIKKWWIGNPFQPFSYNHPRLDLAWGMAQVMFLCFVVFMGACVLIYGIKWLSGDYDPPETVVIEGREYLKVPTGNLYGGYQYIPKATTQPIEKE